MQQIVLSFTVGDEPVDAAALSILVDQVLSDELGEDIDTDVWAGEPNPFTPAETLTLIRAGAELYESFGDPADVLSAHQKSLLERAQFEVVGTDGPDIGDSDVCKHCGQAIDYLDGAWYAPVDGQAVADCPSNEANEVHEPMGDL